MVPTSSFVTHPTDSKCDELANADRPTVKGPDGQRAQPAMQPMQPIIPKESADGRTIKVHELYDIEKLAAIASEPTAYDLGLDPEQGLDTVKRLLAFAQTGHPVTYTQHFYKRVHMGFTFGRYYAKCPSLQGLCRSVRNTIVDGYVKDGKMAIDVDFVNAHPTLLAQYCDRIGVGATVLHDYVEHRNEYLEKLAVLYPDHPRPTKEAKRRLIAMLFGGKPKGAERDNELFMRMYEGIQEVHQVLKQHHPTMYERAHNSKAARAADGAEPYNVLGTMTSFILCDLENQCLQAMIDAVEAMPDVDQGSLMFDGCYLHVTPDVARQPDELCERLMAAVREETGFEMKVISKPIDQVMQVDNTPAPMEQLLAGYDGDLEYLKSLEKPKDMDYVQAIIARRDLYRIDGVWHRFDRERGRWLRTSYDSAVLADIEALVTEVQAKTRAASFYTRILDYLKKRVPHDVQFDRDPYMLGFDDCAVDLRTGARVEFSRDLLICKSVGFNYTDLPADTAEVERMIRRIYPVPEVYDYVMDSLAVSLYGTSLTRMHVCIGKAANGKSTLTGNLAEVLGDYGRESDVGLLCSKNEFGGVNPQLVQLAASRFVMMEEADANTFIRESAMKRVVGGRRIQARDLYSSNSDHANVSSIWMCCNNIPLVDKLSDGGRRRMVIIPHESRFTDKPGDVDEDNHVYLAEPRLMSDEAFRRNFGRSLLAILLGRRVSPDRHGEPPEVLLRATEGYFSEMSPVVTWFNRVMEESGEDPEFSPRIPFPTLAERFAESDEYRMLNAAAKKSYRSNASILKDLLENTLIAERWVEKKPKKNSFFWGYVERGQPPIM